MYRLYLSLITCLISLTLTAQTEYLGNSITSDTGFGFTNTTFGGTVGESMLDLDDDGTTITGTFTKGTNGNFDDMLVIYISNGNPGRAVIDSDVNDQQDDWRKAISSAGSQASEITFDNRFEATHAIAIQAGSGNQGKIFSIPETGAIGNGGLNLVDNDIGNPTTNTDNQFTFSFNWSDIGLTSSDSFRFVATYVDPSNGNTSNEGYGADFVGATPYTDPNATANDNTYVDGRGDNIGNDDFIIPSSYIYPSPNQNEDVLYNDFYQYYNPFNGNYRSSIYSFNFISSWAYAATNSDGWGARAIFDNPDNAGFFELSEVSFIMSNWDNDIQQAFDHPFTLELYTSQPSPDGPIPKDTLASITQDQTIPKQVDNLTKANSGFTGRVPNTSNNTITEFLINFDLNDLVVNTDKLIYVVKLDISAGSGDPDTDNNGLDDRLDQMNISAYGSFANPEPTIGSKNGDYIYWFPYGPGGNPGDGVINVFQQEDNNGDLTGSGNIPARFTGRALNEWTGAEDNNFNNPNNWTKGVVPDITDNAPIPGNTPIAKINANDNANVKKLFVNGTLEVQGTLKVDQIFENNGQVTFKSDENGTGQLKPFNGSIRGDGDFTVQRFIPAGTNDLRAFRFLTTAVDSNGTIREDWQEDASSNTDDPHPGFGTHITGTTAADGTKGFDATGSGQPSLLVFDNISQTWSPIDNTDNTSLEAGNAYNLFVRGSRSIDLTASPTGQNPSNTTLRSTGTLATGNLTTGTEIPALADDAGEFSFIGNPYQAIVNINDLNTTNLNPNFYWVWDPNKNQQGGYVPVSLPAGTNPGTSDANQFIQPGQSFFVQNSTTTPSNLTFTESAKDVTQTPTQVFSNNNQTSINLLLYTDQALNNNDGEADALGINFNPNGNNGVDQMDAAKFTNIDENIARLNNGNLISIENRAMPVDGESLELFTDGYTASNYTFVVNVSNLPDDVNAYLVDHYAGNQTLLSDGANQISFTVDTSTPDSEATDRFSIDFEETLGIDDNELANQISLYPNPTDGQFTIQTKGVNADRVVNIYNMNGKQVFQKSYSETSNGELNVNAGNLASGVYMVEMTANKESFTNRLIIK